VDFANFCSMLNIEVVAEFAKPAAADKVDEVADMGSDIASIDNTDDVGCRKDMTTSEGKEDEVCRKTNPKVPQASAALRMSKRPWIAPWDINARIAANHCFRGRLLGAPFRPQPGQRRCSSQSCSQLLDWPSSSESGDSWSRDDGNHADDGIGEGIESSEGGTGRNEYSDDEPFEDESSDGEGEEEREGANKNVQNSDSNEYSASFESDPDESDA